MLVRPARVVACPPDNGLVIPEQFEGWSFSNLHPCCFLCRGWAVFWRVLWNLSGCWSREGQPGSRYEKHSVSEKTFHMLNTLLREYLCQSIFRGRMNTYGL